MRRASVVVRRFAWIAFAMVVLALVTLRALISIASAEQRGLRLFDLVGLGILCSLGLIGFMLWLIKSRARAVTRAVRALHPGDIVCTIAIRAEEIAQLSALGRLQHSIKPSYGAVVLGRTTCAWWTGARLPRKIAEIVSESPAEYRVGTYIHAGLAQTNLIANLSVGGRRESVPLVLLREPGIFLGRPRDGELEELVTLLTYAP